MEIQLSFCDLRLKEVINTCDGTRLGRIIDIVFDLCGRISGIVVPGIKRFLWWRSGEDIFIPWRKIDKIGNDIILVNLDGKEDDKHDHHPPRHSPQPPFPPHQQHPPHCSPRPPKSPYPCSPKKHDGDGDDGYRSRQGNQRGFKLHQSDYDESGYDKNGAYGYEPEPDGYEEENRTQVSGDNYRYYPNPLREN